MLDWNAPHNYMAHELGHILGWNEHSWGLGKEYGDPYCIMSAETYGDTNPTHRRPRPDSSRIPTGYKRSFWDGFGPMPAAATLYKYLPPFASSSMVARVGLDQEATIRALSEASLGESVLAAWTDDYGVDWMAELRIATGWDGGLDGPDGPGSAVILHTLQHHTADGSPPVTMYHGKMLLKDPRQTSVQPAGVPDVRLVFDYYDPGQRQARVRFTRQAPPAAVGSPAPEFAPQAFDDECKPAAGQYSIALTDAYQRTRNGGGERVRINVILTDTAGGTRIGLGKLPAPDLQTGGIVMTAHECVNGHVVAQWTVRIVEFLASYVVRIDGPGLDGDVGSVPQDTGIHHEADGSGIELRSWGVPSIQ